MKETKVISKTLKGYSRYLFFSNGRIFNLITNKYMRDHDDGKNGYRKIKLVNDEGARIHWYLNRLFYTVFYGPILAGMEIDHNNGDRLDNRPDNLSAMTHLQNMRMKKQRDCRSLFHHNAKKGTSQNNET